MQQSYVTEKKTQSIESLVRVRKPRILAGQYRMEARFFFDLLRHIYISKKIFSQVNKYFWKHARFYLRRSQLLNEFAHTRALSDKPSTYLQPILSTTKTVIYYIRSL
jgi:hypothetical protein